MVQDLAVRLLVRQDNISRREKQEKDLRLAMLSTGRHDIADLFPEYFVTPPEEATDEDAPDDVYTREGVEYDYSDVEWQSPSDMSEEERQEMMNFISDTSVSVSLDPDDVEGEWV